MLEGHLDTVTTISVTSDDRILVTGSGNGDFRVWYVEGARCVHVKEDAHEGGVQDCDFSENSLPIPYMVADGLFYLLATCGNDSMVKLWQLSLLQVSLIFLVVVAAGLTVRVIRSCFSLSSLTVST